MQLNPSEISELIKSRIENLGVAAEVRNEGTVVTVTDGICRVHGLSMPCREMLGFRVIPSRSRSTSSAIPWVRSYWVPTNTSQRAIRSNVPDGFWKSRSGPN